MNILIPTADYPPIEGGISTVTLELSRQLAARGHTVTLIAPYFPEQQAFDQQEPAQIIRFRGYGFILTRLIGMILYTLPYLRSADLIIAINPAYGGIIAWIASLLFGTPYIAPAYAYEFLKYSPGSVPARFLRKVYRRAHCVVAISRFTRDQLIAFGVPAENIEVILPGAPLPTVLTESRLTEIKQQYLLDMPHIILSVGRFVPRKGHMTVIEALPKILAAFPDTLLVMVGRGPHINKLLKQAAVLGVREQTCFPGVVSAEVLAAFYQACTVFVLPAESGEHGQVEGFGLVFAEANAYGKPVVAGNSGGVPDAVIDGQTGLLVEPGNPDAVADAVIRIFKDPAWGGQLGLQGQSRVTAELNWTVFTDRLLETFQARCAERAAQRN